jgi:DNA-directed RNA polymerase subunit RPC12/RpoP
MEWQYVCSGCGDIVERLTSLTSATAHYFCQVCSADRDAALSDFIEVTFSLSPEIRRSRYHDPWSLRPEEYFFDYRFTQNGVVDDGTPLRDHLRRCAVACAFVTPGSTEVFSVTAEPGFLSEGFRAEIAAGGGARRKPDHHRRRPGYGYATSCASQVPVSLPHSAASCRCRPSRRRRALRRT